MNAERKLKVISVHELVYLEDKLQRYEKDQSANKNNWKALITQLRKQIREAKAVVRDTKEFKERMFSWLFLLLLAVTQTQFDLTDELRRPTRTRTQTARTHGRRKEK